MSFLCTTINKEVDYEKCQKQCQYIFKSACIDRMNEAYNQALEDMRKAILTDNELQFAPYSQDMWFKNRIMDIAERLTR